MRDVFKSLTVSKISPCLLFACIAMISVVLSTATMAAQTGQGSINGRVTDPQGAHVAGAQVVVTNTSTQIQNTTKTDHDGSYNVTSLDPGTYSIAVNQTGFKRAVVDNVIVSAGAAVETDVPLSIGEASATVTVTAATSLLSNTSDVSTTVDHQLVENLPYPEQSSLEAVLLVPGVNGDPLNPGGIATENPGYTTGNTTPGATISIGGNPPGGNAYLVDGSDALQASYSRVGVSLSGQNVGEVTVITSGMPANYGRSGSGVIVETSRAGTDQYHGGITWRHTDPAFNAYPLGGTIKNNIHQNFYGFYFGGPVLIPKVYHRNRNTFFWLGIEPARLSNVVGVRGTFQTPDDLAGHLNNSLSLLNQTILKSSGYAAALAAPRTGGIYYQSPTNASGFPSGAVYSSNSQYQQITGPLADCGSAYAAANPSATSCPNDVGPQLAQNPFAKYVLSLFPTPTNPGPYVKFDSSDAAYQTDGTNGSYERGVNDIDNRYSFRIDQQFNNSNRVFFRYTVIPISGPRFFASSADNPVNQTPTYVANGHDFAMGYTHIFTDNLITNFHYSLMRDNQQTSPPLIALTQDYAAKYGLTPAIDGKGFPILGSFNDNSNAEGYTIQPGNLSPSEQIDENFVVGDNFIWTRGTHNIQFGVDIRWIQSNQYDNSGLYGGKYSFSQGTTNNGTTGGVTLASFILGEINGYTNTPLRVPAYYRWRYYAGYVQDDWRATSKLTINAGLRYEVETPRMEKFNNQPVVVPFSGTLNGLATNSAFCFSGACGLGKTLWPTNYWGLEPRFGIAYATSPRTTVRASYALSRLPLTGWDPTAVGDPDLNVPSASIGGQNGGVNPGFVDYVSNPIKGPLTSTLTALNGQRGPIYSSTGLAPVFVDQSNAVPYMQTYGMSIQYQPASKTLLQVTYQGVNGTHLMGQFSVSTNTVPIGTIITAIQQNQYLGGQGTPNPYGISNPGSTTPLNETYLQRLYPYQNFFNQALPEIFPRNGVLHYNGLYISVNQRATKDLTFLANYAWSKGLDDVPDTNSGVSSGFGTAAVQNPFDLGAEYSVSSFDQPSKLKLGYNYNLPFGIGERFATHNGIIDRIIGNFSTSGIITSASGFPNYVTLGGGYGYFTSITPAGTNGCTTSGTNKFCTSGALPTGYTLRPSFVPGVPLINKNWKKNPFSSTAPGGITDYLNPAAFAIPGSLNNPQFGNVPRTMSNARSPREFMFDAHVQKGFTVRENYRINLNANFINAFNHPVYFGVTGHTLLNNVAVSTVTGNIASTTVANFGQLSQGNTAGFSRVIQVGASLTF
jgi:hypothetical protein